MDEKQKTELTADQLDKAELAQRVPLLGERMDRLDPTMFVRFTQGWWRWYVAEFDGENKCYGAFGKDGWLEECFFDLSALETHRHGPVIVDTSFVPTKLSEINEGQIRCQSFAEEGSVQRILQVREGDGGNYETIVLLRRVDHGDETSHLTPLLTPDTAQDAIRLLEEYIEPSARGCRFPR